MYKNELIYIISFTAIGFALFVCADEASWSTSGYGTSGDVTIEYNENKTLIIDDSVSLATLTVNGAADAVLTLSLGEGGSFVANEVIVNGGVLKQGTASVFGATPKVTVNAGGTFDMNGLAINGATQLHIAGDGAGNWPWALTSSSGASGNILGGVYLTADATIGGENNIKIGQSGDGYHVYLQNHTMTKTGNGILVGTNMNTDGMGTIDVVSGGITANQWNNLNSSVGETTLILRNGTSFANNTDRTISVSNLVSYGASFGSKAIGVKKEMRGYGSIPNLVFNDGVTASLLGELSITSMLTLNGSASFLKDDACEGSASVAFAALTLPETATVVVGEGVVFDLGTKRTDAKFDVNGTLKITLKDNEDFISLNVLDNPESVEVVDASGNPADAQVSYSDATKEIAVVKVVENIWTPRVDSNLSTLDNWSLRRLPENGEKFAIEVSNDAQISVDITLKAAYASIYGDAKATFNDHDGSELVVSNLLVMTDVVVAGSSFQPQSVSLENGGTLAIGDGGCLRDAVFTYSYAFPTIGDAFSATTVDSDVVIAEKWTGTVWLKSVNNMVGTTGFTGQVFKPNEWGNVSSKIRVTGIKGWINSTSSAETNTIIPDIELMDDGTMPALWLNNGASYGNNNLQHTKFTKLSGSGTLKCDGSALGVLLWVVNWEDFAGSLSMANKGVVFGSSIPAPDQFAGARIYIMEGAEVSVPEGKTWAAANSNIASSGIYVYGTLRASSLDRIGGDTKVNVGETGKFVLFNNGDVLEQNRDFSRVLGQGVLKLESAGNYWRTVSINNYPATLALECAETNGVLLATPGVVHSIGSLMGSGSIRSDYNTGDRDLRIYQSRDTEWSGVFSYSDRIGTVYVTNGVASAGTLTMSGTQPQAHSNKLVIESGASLNITGQWNGDVTVSNGSRLSGTGTIEGTLTLNNGSILRVNGDGSEPLKINGPVSSANGAIVTIEIPEDTAIRRFSVITATSGLSNISFVCSNSAYSVRVTDTAVTVTRKGFSVIVR